MTDFELLDACLAVCEPGEEERKTFLNWKKLLTSGRDSALGKQRREHCVAFLDVRKALKPAKGIQASRAASVAMAEAKKRARTRVDTTAESVPEKERCGYNYRLQAEVVQCGPLPTHPPGRPGNMPRHGAVRR